MNHQIKLVLLPPKTQLPPNLLRLIRRTRNMHFPPIWLQKLPNPLPRMVKVVMVMSSIMVRSRCSSARSRRVH